MLLYVIFARLKGNKDEKTNILFSNIFGKKRKKSNEKKDSSVNTIWCQCMSNDGYRHNVKI